MKKFFPKFAQAGEIAAPAKQAACKLKTKTRFLIFKINDMDTDQTRTEPVSKEVTVDAPVERVWKAITDKDEMKHWYFDLANFKPEVGFEFQFTGGTDERKYVHLCKILEVIPGKKLKHSWKYEGYPGESFVTFELFNDGGKTKVKLMHEGLESFGNKGDFAKENFVAGWNDIIGRSLKEYVEKK